MKRKPGERHIDPEARGLPFTHWPAEDQHAWKNAFREGDVIDGDIGPGQHWSAVTREKCSSAYGRWLGFLDRGEDLKPTLEPAGRITKDSVTRYLEHLKMRGLAPASLRAEIYELSAAARILAPDQDWGWLRRAVTYLQRKIVPVREKVTLPIPEIAAKADAEMATQRVLIEAEATTVHGTILRQPLGRYRTALMIALLIACPTMRLSNITMIRIGRHLVTQSDGFRLSFAAEEMKNRRALVVPVPAHLTPAIRFYLERVRRQLLGANVADHLWISHNGKPMVRVGVGKEIKRMTARVFGKAMTPHAFRYSAATWVATDDSKHVGITSQLLGHADPRAAEKYYIQASALVAGRKFSASINRLRQDLRPRNRDQEDVA